MKSWLKYSSLCRKTGRLALSHKTLVMLLGTDPSKQSDQPLPTTYPQVTFPYMKHMWNENKKVGKWIAVLICWVKDNGWQFQLHCWLLVLYERSISYGGAFHLLELADTKELLLAGINGKDKVGPRCYASDSYLEYLHCFLHFLSQKRIPFLWTLFLFVMI